MRSQVGNWTDDRKFLANFKLNTGVACEKGWETNQRKGFTRLIDVVTVKDDTLKEMLKKFCGNVYIANSNNEGEKLWNSSNHNITVVTNQGMLYYSGGSSKVFTQNLLPKKGDKSTFPCLNDTVTNEQMSTSEMNRKIKEIDSKLQNSMSEKHKFDN